MKLYFTYEPVEAQVVEMTEDEFAAIMDARDTPEFIHIVGTDDLHYNSYTCLQGYDGTCRCISHQRKVWDSYSLSDLSSPPRR